MAKPVPPPTPRNMRDVIDPDVPFFTALAPPARREYVAAIYEYALRAAMQPYAVTLLCTDTCDAAGTRWHWAQAIGPHTYAMKAYVTRSMAAGAETGTQPSATQLWSDTTAPLAADRCDVPSPIGDARGGDTFPPGPYVGIAGSAEVWNDTSPAAGDDRLLEISSAAYPHTEAFSGGRWACLGGRVWQEPDIS